MTIRTLIAALLIGILIYFFYAQVLVKGAGKDFFKQGGLKAVISGGAKGATSKTSSDAELVSRASQLAERYFRAVQSSSFSSAVALYAPSALSGLGSESKAKELENQLRLFGPLENFQLVNYSMTSGGVSLIYSVTYRNTNTQESMLISLGGVGLPTRGMGSAGGGSAGGSILLHEISSNLF